MAVPPVVASFCLASWISSRVTDTPPTSVLFMIPPSRQVGSALREPIETGVNYLPSAVRARDVQQRRGLVQVMQRRETLPCLHQGSAHGPSVTAMICGVTTTGVTPQPLPLSRDSLPTRGTEFSPALPLLGLDI